MDVEKNSTLSDGTSSFLEKSLLACRVCDGLFVGNYISSQDLEFIFSNKITHIINCCGPQVKNQFQSYSNNIKYLTFNWPNDESSVWFDSRDENLRRVIKFIEKSFSVGECVLIHSLKGTNRCCALVVGIFMKKYKWEYEKAMKFVSMNHPDMNVTGFLKNQLQNLGKRISTNSTYSSELLEKEQLLLTNTYLNCLPFRSESRNRLLDKHRAGKRRKKAKKKVKFSNKIDVIKPTNFRRKLLNSQDLKSIIKKSVSKEKNNNEKIQKKKQVKFQIPDKKVQNIKIVNDVKKEIPTKVVHNGKKEKYFSVQRIVGRKKKKKGKKIVGVPTSYVDYLISKNHKDKKSKSLFFYDSSSSFVVEENKKEINSNDFNKTIRTSLNDSGGEKSDKFKLVNYPLLRLKNRKQRSSSLDNPTGKSRDMSRNRKGVPIKKTRKRSKSNMIRSMRARPRKFKKVRKSNSILIDRREYVDRNQIVFPKASFFNRKANQYRKRAPTPISRTRKEKASKSGLRKVPSNPADFFRKKNGSRLRLNKTTDDNSRILPKSIKKRRPQTALPITRTMEVRGFNRKTSKNSNRSKYMFGNYSTRKRNQLIYDKYFRNLSYT